jgi:hypothetical protein
MRYGPHKLHQLHQRLELISHFTCLFFLYFVFICSFIYLSLLGRDAGTPWDLRPLCRLIHWLWWGETDVSELQPLGAYCSSPGDSMWTMVWWYRLGLTPNLSTRVLWQPPVLSGGPVFRDISGASTGIEERKWEISLFAPVRSLTCRKIFRHGTSGFTSHPKEVVLRIFIALKNPSPGPGSNPRT